MTQIENIACVAAFLVYLEKEQGPNAMWGSRTVSEAIEAFANLCHMKPDSLRELCE